MLLLLTSWYVPHTLLRKIREVYDCFAQYANLSINDKLMLATHLVIQNFDVLLRLQEEHVAFMADTKSILYQFLALAQHKNLPCYL